MWIIYDRRFHATVAASRQRPRNLFPWEAAIEVTSPPPDAAHIGCGLCLDPERRTWYMDPRRHINRIRRLVRRREDRLVAHWTGAALIALVEPTRTWLIWDRHAGDRPDGTVRVFDNDGRNVELEGEAFATEPVRQVDLGRPVRVEGADLAVVEADDLPPRQRVGLSETGRVFEAATPRGHLLHAVGRASARVRALVERGPEPVDGRPDVSVHVADTTRRWSLRAAPDAEVLVVWRERALSVRLREPFDRLVLGFLAEDGRHTGFGLLRTDGFERPADLWWPWDAQPVEAEAETHDRQSLHTVLVAHGMPETELRRLRRRVVPTP